MCKTTCHLIPHPSRPQRTRVLRFAQTILGRQPNSTVRECLGPPPPVAIAASAVPRFPCTSQFRKALLLQTPAQSPSAGPPSLAYRRASLSAAKDSTSPASAARSASRASASDCACANAASCDGREGKQQTAAPCVCMHVCMHACMYHMYVPLYPLRTPRGAKIVRLKRNRPGAFSEVGGAIFFQ